MRFSRLFLLALALPTLSPAQAPATASFDGVGLYDQTRGRLVVGKGSGEVFEFDGAVWALSSARLPGRPLRAVHHPARKQSLWLTTTNLYEFDGHAFRDLGTVATNPNAFLAFDIHRDRLVLADSVGTTFRLREWDGQSWHAAPALPGLMLPMGIAYDEARRRCVITTLRLTGGIGYDTLEWDGQAFTTFPMGAPLRRSIAFDPVRQQVVSFSAGVEGWNGSQWTSLQVPGQIAPLQFTFDSAQGKLLGYLAHGLGYEFWSWDGSQWTFQQRSGHPTLSSTPGFVFDAARDRAVLLGGGESGSLPHFEWDGSRWHDRAGPGTPPARLLPAMVHDPVRGETLVFGGGTSAGFNNELWAFDGTTWTLRSTSGPSPRSNGSMAFDSIRGEVVLVGGRDATGSPSDQWRWDGSSWRLVQATNPLTNFVGPIGFDPVRDAVVMVDGFGWTYEYRGGAWALAAIGGTTVPNALVFDGGRGRLVASLSGGIRHEWTGTQWSPIPGEGGVLAYDPNRGLMLNYLSTRLLVESAQPALAEHLGVGCGGTAIGTTLTAFGWPRLGNTEQHLDFRAEAALRPAVLGFGFAGPATPLGNGCILQLGSTFASSVWFTDPAGMWHAPFPIPSTMTLRGAVFAVQGGVLDPASPGGFGLSNTLSLTVGD